MQNDAIALAQRLLGWITEDFRNSWLDSPLQCWRGKSGENEQMSKPSWRGQIRRALDAIDRIGESKYQAKKAALWQAG
jgi:hypothetical protein